MTAVNEKELSATELADQCDSLMMAWHSDAVLSQGGAAPGAQAEIDAASARRDLPGGTPNIEHAHEQIAGRMIDATVLLLQSIVTLLRAQPMIALGVWPLVRAQLEYGGRVAWLLEPFPGEDVGSRRVARAMLEHLSALQRERYTANKFSKAQARVFKRKRIELQGRIENLFSDVETPLESPDQINQWKIGGEKMLPLGKAAELFVTQNFTNGSALYDVLSDRSHPSIIALALQSDATDSNGVTIWAYPASPTVLNFQVRLACQIVYKLALTNLHYFGFPADALRRWAELAPAHWFDSPEV